MSYQDLSGVEKVEEAGALGGFAAGAIIGSTIGHGGYYGPPKASHP
jgi:hypothetical protein